MSARPGGPVERAEKENEEASYDLGKIQMASICSSKDPENGR
jgi:hypothetical protein